MQQSYNKLIFKAFLAVFVLIILGFLFYKISSRDNPELSGPKSAREEALVELISQIYSVDVENEDEGFLEVDQEIEGLK